MSLCFRKNSQSNSHANEADRALATGLGLERQGTPTAVMPPVEAAGEPTPELDQSPVAAVPAK